MAGLAGIIYRKKKRMRWAKESDEIFKRQVEKMLQKISYRGSRNKEIFSINNSGFGAIIGFISNYKISGTKDHHTKKTSSKTAPTVKVDGKIYNTDKLYKKYKFRTAANKNENEKLAELLTGFNNTIIKKLNGQFAMVFKDESENIYIIRDFLGRKPLYYAYNNDANLLFFASEIKSLSKFNLKIIELPPGHYIKNMGKPVLFRNLDSKKYGEEVLQSELPDIKDENIMINRINDLLIRSIDKRIPKDRPNIKIGAWLSGGLDSSIIAALLKQRNVDIHTFAVGFEGAKDLEAARIVSKHLGTIHKEYILNEDILFSLVPETIYILESFDAPLVRSTLGNIIASKMSSGTDIVFSGEGGDEIFAGYNYFLNFNSKKQIQNGLLKAIKSLHNTALQRVDRSSNFNGVNIKLPMLDEELIDYVLHIPPRFKLNYTMKLTKHILRKLAEKYLPDCIVWRPKDKFWEGSGIYDSLKNRIDCIISDNEFENSRILPDGFKLRNKEEFYYYQIFRIHYPEVDYNNFLSFTENFN